MMTAAPRQPKTTFISLRWRFLLPIFIAVMIASMIGAYWVGNQFTSSVDAPQTNLLLQNSRAVAARITELYEQSRLEGQRIAFTSGVVDAIRQRAPADLQPILEGPARLANLDSVIVTDSQGVMLIGLLRVERAGGQPDYAVNTNTELGDALTLIPAVRDDGYIGATQIVRTTDGLMLDTAVPVNSGQSLIGIAIIGQRLAGVLDALKSDGSTDVALYGPENSLLQTTINTNAVDLDHLSLTPDLFQQTFAASQQVSIRNFQLGAQPYQAAYFPFQFGPQILGVVAVIEPDNVPFLTGLGQQFTALALASVAAALVVAVFFTVNTMMVGRLKRITRVATALAQGEATARTLMTKRDEIGAVGQALDRYADYVRERQDTLRTTLRRQRRETEYLMAVLESMPDGIVVQDLDGRIVAMSERARVLLGSQRAFREAGLDSLTALVTDKLGAALAPGLYAMGDPRRVELEGKMLSAQVAGVTSIANQRVGTVIVLRDITADVRRERAQEAIMARMQREAQQPFSEAVRNLNTPPPMNSFVSALNRHAISLQKLIVEMRDITMPDALGIQESQRPLRVETLLWAVANEWRQVASAANLGLEVLFARRGLYVLGDERRLRWAIGNLVDNAIKYTLPGGKLMLEVQGEGEGKARLRIRDNGTGISDEDLPQVFTRFYRGTPTTRHGYVIRVPGMGQGLTTARQIIEAHGGMIQIKSKVGVGTAVYFTLTLTSPVSWQLPQLPLDADLEGETVRLREDEI